MSEKPSYMVPGEKAENSPLSFQVAGDHYKTYYIQPVVYCQKNGLNFCESNVVKLVTRHQDKGRDVDIRKAIHYLELILEIEYGVTP